MRRISIIFAACLLPTFGVASQTPSDVDCYSGYEAFCHACAETLLRSFEERLTPLSNIDFGPVHIGLDAIQHDPEATLFSVRYNSMSLWHEEGLAAAHAQCQFKRPGRKFKVTDHAELLEARITFRQWKETDPEGFMMPRNQHRGHLVGGYNLIHELLIQAPKE